MPVLLGAEPFSADGGSIGVVLSHGFTGSPQGLRPWAEHLAAAGCTVRLPRLPGHGTSWQEMNATRWTDWYAEIERVYDELANRCEHVFAGGLSMGGTLVTRLAEEKGNAIGGLVLVNPAYATQRRFAGLAKYVAPVIKSQAAIGNDIKMAGPVELAYDRTPIAAFASLQELWKVTLADLPKVTAPDPDVPKPSGPRRRTALWPAAARRSNLDDGARGDTGGQLSRRDVGQRRAADLRSEHRVHSGAGDTG